MKSVLSIDLYQLLEDRLGREDARKLAEAIELAFDAMEKRAEALAIEKKLEIKDELTKELATKADIARLEGEIKTLRQEIQTLRADLEGKIESSRADLEGKISNLKVDFEGKISNLKVDFEGKISTLKADLEGKISALKADLEGKISSLRMEFRIYFIAILAVIILSSPRAIDLIGKLLGVLK
ncbi:MAG: hypothetical protein ACP5TY_05145 [Thermodesulforhabdaceae bacterium]|jgi:SMC interacting uncharacterized protein involved in chromosome segregation